MLMAVSCLSPVSTHTLMPALRRVAMLSGTPYIGLVMYAAQGVTLISPPVACPPLQWPPADTGSITTIGQSLYRSWVNFRCL